MTLFRRVLRLLPPLTSLAFVAGLAGLAGRALADTPAPSAAEPLPVITTGSELANQPAALRSLPHPLKIEITSLYYDPYWKLLWGIDSGGYSFYPLETAPRRFRSGQRWALSGQVVPAIGLPLGSATLLPDVPLPAAIPLNGEINNLDHFTGRLVSAQAFVNAQSEVDANHLLLELTLEGEPITARVLIAENSPIPQVEGAFVSLSGLLVADAPPSPSLPNIWVPRPEQVTVLQWLDQDPRFNIDPLSFDQLSTAPASALVHIIGTVQSQKPGEVVLRDETGQVTLLTGMTRPLAPGVTIDAFGYPSTEGLNTFLRQSFYRSITAQVSPTPTRGLPLLRLAAHVRRLTADQAERGYDVRLRGVITWSHRTSRTCYLLDASGGIAITLPAHVGEPPTVGTRIELTGRSQPGAFAPAVAADALRVLDQLSLPPPRPVTLEQALTGVEEGQWISLSGYVRATTPEGDWTRLALTTSAGGFTAVLPHSPRLAGLQGSVIRVRGTCRAVTDDTHQLTAIELWVNSDEQISIEEPKPVDPFAEPLRSIASLRRFSAIDAFNHRVHLAGTVLHHDPGNYLNLQEGAQSLMVLTHDTAPLHPGDHVEVVGLPGRQGPRVVLREAVYRSTAHDGEPTPFPLDTPDLLHPELDGRLVRIVATLVDRGQRAAGVRLVCQTRYVLFEALGPRDFSETFAAFQPGSEIALTGVYVVQFDQDARPRAFQLQLRYARDLTLVRAAPWWTAARTRNITAALTVGILLGFAWVAALRRRVHRQTAEIRVQLEKSSRLETELVRASKLESLGVLAGGIAHDFNNLLTVIIGNLSLVISDRRLHAEDEHFLQESERAALRARDLTQQLLTFAKGGAPLRSAVLLPDIVREAAGFALHGSKVRCDLDFAPSLWPAHVDRGQISQVVHNIVINALQAMPTGGVVSLTLRNETLAAGAGLPLEPGRYLQLSIRDSGSGISPQHLPRIFDPYFTTKQQGSGLGLATVYSIVRKHGGHISVDSVLGQGTTFHIWLPAADTPAVPSLSAAATAPRLQGRALIMDDEAPVRDMAAAILRRSGMEVTTVPDGTEAIREYVAGRDDGRPYAVVILDLTVPGAMGGSDALAELRRIDPSVCAIVSSGYSNDPVMSDHRRYGFRACAPKPYEALPFAHVVAGVLATLAPSPDPADIGDPS